MLHFWITYNNVGWNQFLDSIKVKGKSTCQDLDYSICFLYTGLCILNVAGIAFLLRVPQYQFKSIGTQAKKYQSVLQSADHNVFQQGLWIIVPETFDMQKLYLCHIIDWHPELILLFFGKNTGKSLQWFSRVKGSITSNIFFPG